MSRITLAPNASGSGTLTVAAPNTNTDRTITLPDATGTVNVSGLANEVPAGSVGSPSIYSTGDSNTGVFFPAADTVAVTTGGTERMRIGSTGNITVGSSTTAIEVNLGGILNLPAATTEGRSIEIGNGRTGNGNAFIDFVGDATYTDFGLRIIRENNGANANSTIAHRGTGALVLKTEEAAAITFSTTATERMRIDASGNVSITQTPGKYTVDTNGGATSIANGGTVDFANASGMLVVNNHNSGAVTIYLCGGGMTAVIGSVGTQVGTFTYVVGIGGYRWTNHFGSTISAGFFFVRTRATA
jgi:hypothetical protein